MGSLSKSRGLYFILLAMWAALAAMSASPLLADFYATLPLAPSKIAMFASQTAQIPLWITVLHSAISRPAGLTSGTTGRVFERSADKLVMHIVAMWAFGSGSLINGFLTGQDGDAFYTGGGLQVAIGLLIYVCAILTFGFYCFGKGPTRLVLSSDGIAYNSVKADLIPWEDVNDIRIVNRLGQKSIAVELVDPGKYGQKKPHFIVRPAVFNADADTMMEIFQQERTLNLL